jgi:hypothetical protein
MPFGDPLLVLVGLVAVIFAGWALFTLLYIKRVFSKKSVVLVVSILSLVGIPLGYYLWSIWYINLGPTVFFGSIAMLCSSFIMFLALGRGAAAAPSRVAAAPPTGVGVERPAPTIEKIDEDVVRLKVEKTATESALKSLEAAVKEGAITKETFEKHRTTYTERLAKLDSELSKKTRVGIGKLEGEIEKVRMSYIDKLKGLSKKAISIKPAPAAAPRAAPVPSAPPARPEPALRPPEIPTKRMEEAFGEQAPTPTVPRIPTPAAPAERPLSGAVRPAPSGPTTISDLRREMMDELNRLKRLIGRAEA